jgi:hypothetical protein
VGYQLERAFNALHGFLSSTINAAGPWAVPGVLAAAVLIALANHHRMLSGFGVFLVLATAALVTLVIAFQTGRV